MKRHHPITIALLSLCIVLTACGEMSPRCEFTKTLRVFDSENKLLNQLSGQQFTVSQDYAYQWAIDDCTLTAYLSNLPKTVFRDKSVHCKNTALSLNTRNQFLQTTTLDDLKEKLGKLKKKLIGRQYHVYFGNKENAYFYTNETGKITAFEHFGESPCLQ